MKYSKEEVIQYVREEDVKFIRLAFCDVFGKQKNISIMPDELQRAFTHGIAFDASAIKGFGDEAKSDLFLHPIPDTLTVLPWRPEHGRVVRMFSEIRYPDGRPFECDTRALLSKAVAEAEKAGFSFSFCAEQEFYLFKCDEQGNPTKVPYDEAGYMDIAPDDKGENVRREICMTLEQMGIRPESSHHEEGPGQNEIDFRYSDALTAADNALTFRTVVRTMAYRNGLFADFSPKPLEDQAGNGFHINMSVKPDDDPEIFDHMLAGILGKANEMTLFLNPAEESYLRFGKNKAPRYITWSHENRSGLIRIPAAEAQFKRAELRSPDPLTNPYIAFTLMIYSGLDGISRKLSLPAEENSNLFKAGEGELKGYDSLPDNLEVARKAAAESGFIREHLPQNIIESYCR